MERHLSCNSHFPRTDTSRFPAKRQSAFRTRGNDSQRDGVRLGVGRAQRDLRIDPFCRERLRVAAHYARACDRTAGKPAHRRPLMTSPDTHHSIFVQKLPMSSRGSGFSSTPN
ncbi:hypothetical protein CDAR_397171 [Caerostris darwini]|uniref:Uncharacterized protein n=1 Tax=Caerostris darwini TaxID=1538125 RepID=A0AAV4Q808_9ARAC|nr:hypothetical protein CDAR_397171 [Caerostris darwini]